MNRKITRSSEVLVLACLKDYKRPALYLSSEFVSVQRDPVKGTIWIHMASAPHRAPGKCFNSFILVLLFDTVREGEVSADGAIGTYESLPVHITTLLLV